MVVVMRALIMLLVLIGVPLLVILGSSLGDRPKEMAIDAWVRWTDTTPTPATTEPDGKAPLGEDTNNVAPRFIDTIHQDAPAANIRADVDKGPVAFANFEQPVRQVGPVRQVAPAPQRLPAAVDRYTAIKQRLRDLGAVYYRLDRLDGPGGEYLFHCEFEDADKPFTATDADLLRSMESVLQQVERWKTGSSY